MAEGPTRRTFSGFTDRLNAAMPLFVLPFSIALLGFIWQLHGMVGEVREDVHALQSGHLMVHTDIDLRVAKIESTRFTKNDWLAASTNINQMATDLAVIKQRVNALKIPPTEVEQALSEIKRRLNLIEQDLRRALAHPGSLP